MYENNIQFAEKEQAGDSEACFAWCHSKHIYQPLCHSTEVPLAWPRPWDMQRHTHRRIHASRKTHKKKCRVTYLKTHCAGLDWARLVDRKWTLGHSVAVFLSVLSETHTYGRHRSFDVRDFQTPDRKCYGHKTNSFQACMIVQSVFLAMRSS